MHDLVTDVQVAHEVRTRSLHSASAPVLHVMLAATFWPFGGGIAGPKGDDDCRGLNRRAGVSMRAWRLEFALQRILVLARCTPRQRKDALAVIAALAAEALAWRAMRRLLRQTTTRLMASEAENRALARRLGAFTNVGGKLFPPDIDPPMFMDPSTFLPPGNTGEGGDDVVR